MATYAFSLTRRHVQVLDELVERLRPGFQPQPRLRKPNRSYALRMVLNRVAQELEEGAW